MHSIPDKGYSYYGEVRLGHSSLVCVSKFYANLKECFFFCGSMSFDIMSHSGLHFSGLCCIRYSVILDHVAWDNVAGDYVVQDYVVRHTVGVSFKPFFFLNSYVLFFFCYFRL